jgi:hypothetical protein
MQPHEQHVKCKSAFAEDRSGDIEKEGEELGLGDAWPKALVVIV